MRWMRWTICLVAAVVTPFGLPVWCQEKAPVKTGLVEQVKVQLIRLPLFAADHNGNPVSDLKAEELSGKVRGEKARIAYLEPLFPSEAAETKPLPVRLYLDLPGGSREPAVAVAGAPSYLIFFIDNNTDDPLRKDEGWDALQAALHQARQGTRFSVLSFNGQLNLDLPFTENRGLAESALRSAWFRSSENRINLKARIRQLLTQLEGCAAGEKKGVLYANTGCLMDIGHQYSEEQRPWTESYVEGLRDLVRFAAGLEGTKSVIGIAHGMATETQAELVDAMRAVFGNTDQVTGFQLYLGWGERARQMLDETILLAMRNKVTLNFIDRTAVPSVDSGASRGRALEPGTAPTQVAFSAGQATLQDLAGATGGTFINHSDLKTGLTQVVQAERGAYEVGLYVEELVGSADLAKIRVSCSRHGVQISHRRGYYGVSPDSLDRGGVRIALGKAETAPDPQSGAVRHPLEIAINPRLIGYKTEGGEAFANIAFHFLVETEDGRVVTDTFDSFRHSFPAEAWDKGKIGPVVINGWIELPPGKWRFVLHLQNTDVNWQGRAVRGLTTPFESGEPAPVDPKPQSSRPTPIK